MKKFNLQTCKKEEKKEGMNKLFRENLFNTVCEQANLGLKSEKAVWLHMLRGVHCWPNKQIGLI